ncbi:uncharacterized protein LOC115456329 [Manduca sexta]|uniref:uncharacterized protein LOC115456329 n=1 Tax=Manduca sexta TaxID=7130 RepID=UPI001181E3FD|nr:uncharacterized protein LOC115456329 [Manduca sexta]
MWSVRNLGVAALVVIVVGEAVAQAFLVYEPIARDVTEFGPSSPIAARDGAQFWKLLMHPKFDRLRRTDDRELSYDFHEILLKPTTSFKLAGAPPPPTDKKNVNKKNQRPPRTQQRESYVPGVTEPELFFKVYV